MLHRRATREALSAGIAAILGLPALIVAPVLWGVWLYGAMLAALVTTLFFIARKHGAGRPEVTPYLIAVALFIGATAYFAPKGLSFITADWGAPHAGWYLALVIGTFVSYSLLLAGLATRIWQVRNPAIRRAVMAAAAVTALPVAVPLVMLTIGQVTLEPINSQISLSDSALMAVIWATYAGNLLLVGFLYRATRDLKVAIVGPPGVGKTQILMRLAGSQDRSMESTQESEDVMVIPKGYNRYMLPIRSRDVPGEDTDAWIYMLATTKLDGLVLVLAEPETEAQRGQWSRYMDEFLDGYRRYSPRQKRLKHVLVLVNKQDQWADGQEPMDVIWPFVGRLDGLEIRGRRFHVAGSCAYSAGGETVNAVTVINNYIDDWL